MNCSCVSRYSPAKAGAATSSASSSPYQNQCPPCFGDADVLRVVGLEEEAHRPRSRYTFFIVVSPKMPEGRTSSTTSTTT